MPMHLIYLAQEMLEKLQRSLFLEASNGANWNPSTNYTIIGGYVSYDVNTSSEQTTSAFVYEKSGSGSSAIYKEWHFMQGSASGVATATSGISLKQFR